MAIKEFVKRNNFELQMLLGRLYLFCWELLERFGGWAPATGTVFFFGALGAAVSNCVGGYYSILGVEFVIRLLENLVISRHRQER